ncbi:MAG: flagellar biosynthetic protein FliO [Rhodothermales bacterium]
MFRIHRRANLQSAAPDRARQLLKRALLFGAGLVLLWLAVQLAPGPSLSETAEPQAVVSGAMEEGGRSSPAALQFLSWGNVAALVLLAGGGGLAYYLRRRSRGGRGPATLIQSVGHLVLSPNQQLRLIRCGDEVLLLGVASGQITLLKTYAGDAFGAEKVQPPGEMMEAPPNVSAMSPHAPQAQGPFARVLQQQMGRYLNTQQTQAPC